MPKKQLIEVEGRELAISNVEKLYYPESGFTKGEVIAFYSEIAAIILPHLRDRPLTLKRYPEGVNGEHFYEKNAPSHTPAWVKTFAIPRSEGGADIRYVLCNDRATLVWVTNLGDIEKHVLLSRAPYPEQPTSIVFDLDPGEPANILHCGQVALHLKGLLASLNLESFVKVSGSKGLHLSVPLNSGVAYEVTQPFAKAIAELAAQQLPAMVVSEMAKTLRRGKVLIDWSQNSDFKTTVCVYAMRAKQGEPFISMPVGWDELKKAVKSGDEKKLFFTPAAAVKRLKKVGDLFESVLTLEQTLPTAFTEALAAGPTPKLSSWPRNRSKSGEDRDKSLREYAAKRDHSRTPEPAARPSPKKTDRKGVHRFVIQKHEASHLHYDWRLEMQGVLRSWAVPKGPPTKLREARLAMHVEDHPLEYETFEGTIPPGNYGAGTVMVWDRGEYEDLTGNPAAAYHAGKMHLIMRGTKLTGEWILVKDRREEGNKWLLIKAGEAMEAFSKEVDDSSVVSGRTMSEITRANDAQWQSNRPASATKASGPRAKSRTVAPRFIEPMQCKAVTILPAEANWTFEMKFDGYRCIAVKHGAELTLFSRNEKILNDRFPKVVEALLAIDADFVLDGEIVALDEQSKPSFQLLQNTLSRALPTYLYAFDLLNANGVALHTKTIEQRREHLIELLAQAADPLRMSPLLQAPGDKVLKAVQKLGLEGVVGKRNGSLYEPGERSGAWIKLRTNREQEFVIGGYVPGAHGFDSLLVGLYESRRLIFVAKVKNGFVRRIRDEIFPPLKQLTARTCPFTNLPERKASRWGESLTAEKMKECRWVKPKLVCQVAFLEWTDAGHLRHCTFLAMRSDKDPRQVVRET
ncbi:MAG: putative ATP-dependent ligase [Chthoniobacter sp.]|nr:putative ATP-dependent ligase [Chthoniobacter sp.]